MNKDQIAFWGGIIIGGGVGFVLVGGGPGGAIGSVAGYLLFKIAFIFTKPDIFQACQKGDLDRVKELLQKKSSFNGFNSDRSTPLTCAAENDHFEIVKLLVKEGAELNKLHPKGATALMKAAFAGNERIVDYLIEKGADPTIKTKLKETAAEYAKGGGHSILEEKLRNFEVGK
mgnify:CR=1 FL=1